MRISTNHRVPYHSSSGAGEGASRPARSSPRVRAGQVRIIGGVWRGSVLRFPAVPGLRPTLDRARETLFNWLAPYLEGAHCLDLCCGSGALGIESLSRGAASVTLVDHAAAVQEHLERTLRRLDARQRALLVRKDARAFLRRHLPHRHLPHHPPPKTRQRYDIVFLDPPYGGRLMHDCCRLLEQSRLLAPEGFLYLEKDRPENLPPLAGYPLHRRRRCGQLWLHLYRGAALPRHAARHTLMPGGSPSPLR